jgi:hypothetical protein
MGLIDIPGHFDQARIQLLRHQLVSHPLMTTESLKSLALRIDSSCVRFHDGERDLATNMSDMFASDSTRQSLEGALDNLHRSRAFVQIVNVRADPAYRALVDDFLEEVSRALPSPGQELLNRDAAAFLASPASVTPFHLDHEQNFLCHIRGKKTLWVWSQLDREVVSERALEIFFREGSLREVGWSPAVQLKAFSFELKPGDTVFMPMAAPHAVGTGDEIAVTFSVLLNTRASLELVDTYRANHLLRRLGRSPSPVGHRPVEDLVKRVGMGLLRRGLALVRGRRFEAAPRWY